MTGATSLTVGRCARRINVSRIGSKESVRQVGATPRQPATGAARKAALRCVTSGRTDTWPSPAPTMKYALAIASAITPASTPVSAGVGDHEMPGSDTVPVAGTSTGVPEGERPGRPASVGSAVGVMRGTARSSGERRLCRRRHAGYRARSSGESVGSASASCRVPHGRPARASALPSASCGVPHGRPASVGSAVGVMRGTARSSGETPGVEASTDPPETPHGHLARGRLRPVTKRPIVGLTDWLVDAAVPSSGQVRPKPSPMHLRRPSRQARGRASPHESHEPPRRPRSPDAAPRDRT